MRRPKLAWRRSAAERAQPRAPLSAGDYEVYVTCWSDATGRYFGTLKIVRKTDGRLLFPFEGAPEIGPYATRDAAFEAASRYGRQIVEGDLAQPET